jgi:hypothetical protein
LIKDIEKKTKLSLQVKLLPLRCWN